MAIACRRRALYGTRMFCSPSALRILLPALLALLAACGPASNEKPVPTTPAAPTPVPPPPEWLSALDALYSKQLRVPGLEDRSFSPEHWWQVATPLLASERGFHVEQIGRSVEGRSLRHATWGEGPIRVLAWSQMHGDESTGTMALADLFRFLGEHPRHPLVVRLREKTTLHFLPLMNPDGAARFQRGNAMGIDLNRDARRLASPEARALKQLHDRVKPDFGFNLHDQRVGYRAGDSERGVAITLLAPPYNEAREVNAIRARAIEVAAAIRIALEPYIAGHMARWDETFNPRAFGDLTTQWGSSTVLIEAGGIEGDPQKQKLRKLYFLALVAGLDAIASGSHQGLPHALYRDLPENGEIWPDLIVHNAMLVQPDGSKTKVDLQIGFAHPLTEQSGTIEHIGDLDGAPARRHIDASGLYLLPIDDSRGIAPETPARFRLSRDPQGRDIVWTLDGDVDPGRPVPPTDGDS